MYLRLDKSLWNKGVDFQIVYHPCLVQIWIHVQIVHSSDTLGVS